MSAQVTLDLTPFEAAPQPASALGYFAGVANLEELLEAYAAARASLPFESDVPSLSARVHSHAQRFLDGLLERASMHVDDATAKRIGSWVSHLDVYAAVKTVESLLNNEHDCALLAVAEERGWDVHFDHVAIRCGSSGERAARRVVALLREHHGYVHCQLGSQRSYRFADGWRAYPLYKILENGLVLRLFLDESEAGHPGQIIQHWNRVYGYTAHHVALRVSRRTPEGRVAVTLPELEAALAPAGAARRYSAGCHLCWVAWPADRPASALDSIARELAVSGVWLTGSPRSPLLGGTGGGPFATRVRRGLDPAGALVPYEVP
jgi:hypothetical protein